MFDRTRIKRAFLKGASTAGKNLGKASVETGKYIGFHAKQRLTEYAHDKLGVISHEERKLYLEGYRKGLQEDARRLGYQRARMRFKQKRTRIRVPARLI